MINICFICDKLPDYDRTRFKKDRFNKSAETSNIATKFAISIIVKHKQIS